MRVDANALYANPSIEEKRQCDTWKCAHSKVEGWCRFSSFDHSIGLTEHTVEKIVILFPPDAPCSHVSPWSGFFHSITVMATNGSAGHSFQDNLINRSCSVGYMSGQ